MFSSTIARRVRGAAALLGAAGLGCPCLATDFEIHTPKAGGKIVIGFKSLAASCEFLTVNIAAGDTAAEKAKKIKDRINADCGVVFTASSDGSTLTVHNNVHPNHRIFIHVKSDDTGEKDQIRSDVDSPWWELWETDGWYEPNGTSTGQSRDGKNQGYLTIGNSRHVAQVATQPGVPLIKLLAVAVKDLHANGVPEAELVDLGEGRAAVRLPWSNQDEFMEFGVDDQGLECTFEERPEPHRLDFQAGALEITSFEGGVASGMLRVGAIIGSDAYAPGVNLQWELQVNGVPHANGTEPIPVDADFSCYFQTPPGCAGSCSADSLGCAHVESPDDWCGCAFDVSIPWSPPANPGDVITLVVDPFGAYVEDHELNNNLSQTIPPNPDIYWDFYPSQLQVVPKGPGLVDIHVEYIVIFGADAAGEPIPLRITDQNGGTVAEAILLAELGGCCSTDADCPTGFRCAHENPNCDPQPRECVGRRQHSFLNVPVADNPVLAATLDPEGLHTEARPGAPLNNTLSMGAAGGVFHDFGIEDLDLTFVQPGIIDVRTDILIETAGDPQPLLLRLINNDHVVADILFACPEMQETNQCCNPNDPDDPVYAANCGMGAPWLCACGGRDCPPDPKKYCICANTGAGTYSLEPGTLTAILDPAGLHVELGGDASNNSLVQEVPLQGDLVDFEVLNCFISPGSIPGYVTVNFGVAIHPDELMGEWLLDVHVLVDGVPEPHTLSTAKIGPLANCPGYDPDDPNDPNDPFGCAQPANPCGQLQWNYKTLGNTLNAFCDKKENENTCYCHYPTIELKKEVLLGTFYEVILDPGNIYDESNEGNNHCSIVAPTGDNCGSPVPVGEGDTPFSNVGATTDGPPEPCGFLGDPAINSDSDIWFHYVANCSSELTISLAPAFDQLLAVYHGGCPPDAPALLCQAAPAGEGLTAVIPVVAGDTFMLRIGGMAGQQGDGLLTLTCGVPCPGDIDNNGEVGQTDLGTLLGGFGTCAGDPAFVPAADFDGDGCIGQPDLGVLLGNWGPCP